MRMKGCLHCRADISSLRANAKFCSETCRKLHHKKTKTKKLKSRKNKTSVTNSNLSKGVTVSKICTVEDCMNPAKRQCKKCQDCIGKSRFKPAERFIESSVGLWVIDAAIAVGTVEVFQDGNNNPLTINDWSDLNQVRLNAVKANGQGRDKKYKYDKCHLSPKKSFGIFHASNFIVAPASINKSLKEQDFNFGLTIAPAFGKWSTKGLSRLEVFHLLNEYCHGSLLEWQLESKFKRHGGNTKFDVEPMDTYSLVIYEIQRLSKWHPRFSLYLNTNRRKYVLNDGLLRNLDIWEFLPRMLENKCAPVKFGFDVSLVKSNGEHIEVLSGVVGTNANNLAA